MKKYFKHLSALTLTLVFVLSGLFIPQTSHAQTPPLCTDVPGYAPQIPAEGSIICVPTGTPGAIGTPSSGASWWTVLSPLTWLVSALGAVSVAILKLASLLTYLAGAILNYIVQYTVVDMKLHLDEAGAVNNAWKVIRDVANMGFIFVLLYAAIMTIIGQGEDNQKLIVRIVVVAILINFSLFFTKVVIDISNILAVMFYDAIAPGTLSNVVDRGLSNSLMQPLDLQSIWNAGIGIQGERLLIIGVMGTIVSLIAAFVFFAISLLFIIRYVVLIFVLVLSPIAFVSFILPKMDKYRDQWWEALSGQAFFAPIYFMLTWIVIVISRGLLTNTGGSLANALTGGVGTGGQVAPPDLSSTGILVNFLIMITMLIASLLIAKEWANKAGGAVGKLTSWATGAAGGATLGMAGRFSRNTLGRAGTALGESDRFREMAAKGGAAGMVGRLALATGKKTGGASFDMRGTGLGGTLGAGKPGGKGGFADYRKKKAEEESKFAASLAPSEKTKAKAKEEHDEAKEKFGANSAEAMAAKVKVDRLEGVKKDEVTKREREELSSDPVLKKEKELEEQMKRKEMELAATQIPELRVQKEQELAAIKQELESAKQVSQTRTVEIKSKYRDAQGNIRAIKGEGELRKEKFAQSTQDSPWAKFRGYNYAAADQIRKGKSKEKKLADAYKEIVKDEEPEAGESETPPATPPPTPPTP